MGVSHTVKKSQKSLPDLTPDSLATFVDLTATYIARWTQRELRHIANNNRLPICWPLPGGGYMIGRDRIVPENGYWRRLDSGSSPKQLFEERQSAIFYCLCRHMGENQIADDIVKYDSEVRVLRNDVAHYNSSLERGIRQKDCFRINVWAARYDDARLHLAEAERLLKKSVAKAKYSKAFDGTGK
jgi:hypothetical protein